MNCYKAASRYLTFSLSHETLAFKRSKNRFRYFLIIDFLLFFIVILLKFIFNPQAPVAQQIADGVVFRPFQREGAEFFQIGPH